MGGTDDRREGSVRRGTHDSGGRLRVRPRSVATALVALAVLLACAGPAAAGRQKVVSGATTLTVAGPGVAAYTAQAVAVIDMAPVTFRFLWDDGVKWSYRLPVAAGGTYDPATARGTLVYKGGLRFVNVATGASLPLTGLRARVEGPSGLVLSAVVGGPPATRADVLESAATLRIEKKSKLVTIRGAQLRLTPQLVVALQTALVGTFDASAVFAAADTSLKLK